MLLLCNRQRQEGKSDSEVDEDDGFESFSVSVEDDKEDGKECFMGFIVCLDNYLKGFFLYVPIKYNMLFFVFLWSSVSLKAFVRCL